MAAPLTLLALLIELMVGYPDRLAQSIGHPVTWMGRLIAWLDRRLNREDDKAEARRRAGAVAVLALLGIVGVVAFVVEQTLLLLPFGLVLVALLASTLLAQRSLSVHVAGVADALEEGGVDAGRMAVAQIVGRDTAELDEAGVARAAIESLAENFSDGVVAPTILMVIAGLPGAAVYKAINTADSMIGHRSRTPPGFRQDGGATRRFRQSSRLAALGAADRRRSRHEPKMLRPPRLGRRPGATARSTSRPMPAIRKRPWPARSASRLAARAPTRGRMSTAPGWAMGGARRAQPISAPRSTSTPAPMGC